jgi:hypothetical protein
MYLKLAQEAIKRTAGKEAGGQQQEEGLSTTTEPPLNTPEGLPLTCSACHRHELNPWSHNPEFTAWCHCHMEPITPDSSTCGDFLQSQVAIKRNHQIIWSHQRSEGILTCADCYNFEPNNGPNPRQGWGKCLKRNQGRYGCATACEEVFTQGEVSNAHLKS